MFASRWLFPAALLASLLAPTPGRSAEDDPKFDDLPKAIKRTVKEKYPKAKIGDISREKNDEQEYIYEIEMTIDGKSVDIIIDAEGDIEAVEKEIEVDDLPRAVIKAARARFPSAAIEKVEEVSDADDSVVYELTFSSKEKKSFEVVMSPNGKILEAEDDDKDDDKKKDKDDDKKGKKKDKDDGR